MFDYLSYRKSHDDKWMTISGDIVEIKHMSTSHIQNSIRLLE